jgi:hypothetical protein
MNRTLATILGAAIGLAGLTTTAVAAGIPGDAGLATVVEGEVTLKTKGEKAADLVPYAKIRDGDQITVSDGGSLEIIYFEGGRVERYAGPATVRIDGMEGESVKGSSPTVDEADASIGEHLAVIPVIMLQAQDASRAGQTRVRGAYDELALDDAEKADVDSARTLYQQMRDKTSDTDILPDMYLASVLLGYELYDEGVDVLKSAVERCPDCDAPRAMLQWAEASSKDS